jgi:hypothetical protein
MDGYTEVIAKYPLVKSVLPSREVFILGLKNLGFS